MQFNQEYPKSKILMEIFISSGALGLLVYLFLIIFQPFGTYEFLHPYKYLLLFPYGLIAFFAFSFTNITTIKRRKWTVIKELELVILALLLFAFISYWYNILIVSKVEFNILNLLFTFLYAFAIGLPVAAIYMLSRFLYLNKWNQLLDTDKERLIEIKTQSKNSTLKILEKNFIYAESADNYCIIYHSIKNNISKSILRLSLADLIHQIESGKIKRCHRSYIINLDKINDIKGNAQGYKISIKNVEHQITISRNYIKKIVPLIPIKK